jgi:RNA polymerase sporulation-specific sigma factor
VAASTQELAHLAPRRARGAGPDGHPDLDDAYLIARAKRGDGPAYDQIVRRYTGFVRMKASSYFLLGGDGDDLVQEGLLGLFKAVRDFRPDRESSFRNFAELCITRQMITAVKTASRNKHSPLNQYVSFAQTPAGGGEGESSLEEVLPGPIVDDPASRVIASEELASLVDCLTSVLSELESEVLTLYLDGRSYEEIADRRDCDTKTVDNALQRVKRKVGIHLGSRAAVL